MCQRAAFWMLMAISVTCNSSIADDALQGFRIATVRDRVGTYLSPDGRWLVVVCSVSDKHFREFPKTVRVCDLHAPEPEPSIRQLPGDDFPYGFVQLGPRGVWLATMSKAKAERIDLWQLTNGDLSGASCSIPITLPHGHPASVHFSEGGRRLIVRAAETHLDVFDLDASEPFTSSQQLQLPQNTEYVQWFVSPDESFVAVRQQGIRRIPLGRDGGPVRMLHGPPTVKTLWNLGPASNDPVGITRVKQSTSCRPFAAFSPNGKWLAWCGEPRVIQLWDLKRSTANELKLPSSNVGRGARRPVFLSGRVLNFSPNSQFLISVDGSGVFAWDLYAANIKGSRVRVSEGNGNQRRVYSAPQVLAGNSIATFTWRHGRILAEVWDTGAVSPFSSARSIDLGPNSRGMDWYGKVVLQKAEERVVLARWMNETGGLSTVRLEHPAPVLGTSDSFIACGPNGRWLATISGTYRQGFHERDPEPGDATVWLWDLHADKPAESARAILTFDGEVYDPKFTDDLRHIVIAVNRPSGQFLDSTLYDGGEVVVKRLPD